MKLYKFFNKNVIIVDSKGESYEGFIDFFTQALDNEENEDSIGLLPTKDSNDGIEFFESDIKFIEIIE